MSINDKTKEIREDNKTLMPIVISKWDNTYKCYELIKVLYINNEILKW